MALTTLSWIFIALGVLTALAIAVDVSRRPQHMGVMNVTWPITGLYFPVIGWWLYAVMGRPDGMPRDGGHVHQEHQEHQEHQSHAAHDQHHSEHHHDGHQGRDHHHHHAPKPKWQSVFVGVTHCGGGCTLGDSLAAPLVSTLGLTVFGSELLAHFTGEFIGAYVFGIAFQLLPMLQMGETNVGRAFVNAIKADTLSLVAFEIGMFGWITIAFLLILPAMPSVASPVYWFMMQIAMVIGFATAYPANWWLINKGIKHGM